MILEERDRPQSVDFVYVHEILGANISEDYVGSCDSGIGKEDIQTAIAFHCVVYNGLDFGLIRSIKLTRLNLDIRIQLVDFLLVSLKIGCIKIAKVDCSGAALGKLMSCSPANAKRRVGACNREMFRKSTLN